jgi:Na+-driven multidrug efflux pump
MRRLFEINTRARLRILFWSVGLALLAAVLAGFSAGSVTAASAPQTIHVCTAIKRPTF